MSKSKIYSKIGLNCEYFGFYENSKPHIIYGNGNLEMNYYQNPKTKRILQKSSLPKGNGFLGGADGIRIGDFYWIFGGLKGFNFDLQWTCDGFKFNSGLQSYNSFNSSLG